MKNNSLSTHLSVHECKRKCFRAIVTDARVEQV
jgi:hypothetical protein